MSLDLDLGKVNYKNTEHLTFIRLAFGSITVTNIKKTTLRLEISPCYLYQAAIEYDLSIKSLPEETRFKDYYVST